MLRYVLGKEVCERDECDAKSVSWDVLGLRKQGNEFWRLI